MILCIKPDSCPVVLSVGCSIPVQPSSEFHAFTTTSPNSFHTVRLRYLVVYFATRIYIYALEKKCRRARVKAREKVGEKVGGNPILCCNVGGAGIELLSRENPERRAA